MALGLKHATKAQLLDALRARYKSASKEEVYRLAYKLYEAYLAGDITGADIKSAWGFNNQQLTTFQTKVQGLHDTYAQILSATGE